VVTVKADVTTAAEGGTSGGTHTFALLVDKGSGAESIIAKGASSGVTITGTSLTYAASGTTDSDQTTNAMTIYRTKITAAWASDTPSGSTTGGSAQTIAKLNITNSANVGNHTATIKYINLGLSTSISNSADRELKVYKDSLSTTVLATTDWLAAGNQNFGDTAITNGTGAANFPDTEIAAGATKLFIFTLDTTDANATAQVTRTLSINFEAGDIGWDDSAGTTLISCNSLPLESKTLSYPN